MTTTAIHSSLVYGATAAATLAKALTDASGQPAGDKVSVPLDLLAMWLTTAHSAGRLDGVREINELLWSQPC